MIAPRYQDYRLFTAVFLSLVILAWLVLALWSGSAYGRYLDHGVLGENDVALTAEYFGLAALFVAGWTLMTVGMMLPTALPLLLLFRRMVSRRPDAMRLVAIVVAGYLGTWVLFGAVAHAGDLGIHTAVRSSHWLEDRSWMLGALVVLTAGAYQFSSIKYLCLEKCRSPYSFIVEHWRGGNAYVEALRLGVHHGVFCVGCCWALMLLMFALGAGHLAWMLAVGAVMAAERNLSWGRKLSTPLGVLLIAAGVGMIIAQLTAGVACAHPEGSC